MTDLEFISKSSTQTKATILYYYKTGFFKHSLKIKLIESFSSQGYLVEEVLFGDVAERLKIKSLLGKTAFFCDVTVETDFAQFSQIFTQRFLFEGKKIVFFISSESDLGKKLKESPFLVPVQIISEIEKSKKTFDTILSHCLTKEGYAVEQITNFTTLKTALSSIYSEKSLELSEFLQKMNFILHVCLTPDLENRFTFQTKNFQHFLQSEEKQKEFFKLHEFVFNFLKCPGEITQTNLFQFLLGMKEPRLCLHSLYHSLFELLQINGGLDKDPFIEFSEFKQATLVKFQSLDFSSIFQFLVRLAEFEPIYNQSPTPETMEQFLTGLRKNLSM